MCYLLAWLIQLGFTIPWCYLANRLFKFRFLLITVIGFALLATALSQLIIYYGAYLLAVIAPKILTALPAFLGNTSLSVNLIQYIIFLVIICMLGWGLLLVFMSVLSRTKPKKCFAILSWLLGGSCISLLTGLFTLALTLGTACH